jgi:hypothetical protein
MPAEPRSQWERAVLDAAAVRPRRNYGECYRCGEPTTEGRGIMVTVGAARNAEGGQRVLRLTQCSRTLCGRCGAHVFTKLLAELDQGPRG